MKQLTLGFSHKTDYSPDNFIPLQSNAQALMVLNAQAEEGMVFYGEKAVGKTHLLYLWANRVGADVVSAKNLPKELTAKNYAIDDLSEASPEAQEQLFHLFNRVKEHGGALAFASSVPTSMLTSFLPDLRSRLLTLHQVEVASPTTEEMRLLLAKESYDRQISISPQVVDYILNHCPRQPAYILALLEKLDLLSMSEKRKISISLVKQVIDEPI